MPRREGPVALVTGANRGIGAALLSRLAARGAVIGTARPPLPAEGPAHWLPLDVTRPEGFEALERALDGQPVRLVVCNAGIYPDRGENLADGFPQRMWEETFATNVTGVFRTVQALLPSLQAAVAAGETAKVAVIASQLGSSAQAGGGSYVYRASKAAAVNLAGNLAVDLAGLGIAVGAYHPGWVRTDMGGPAAAISAEEAADGLIARFDELTPETAGRFLTWDGRVQPF